MYRTVDCGSLRKEHVGTSQTLSGWVHRIRNLGGLIFIDLRDYYGITQLFIDPEVHPEIAEKAQSVRIEFVITVSGEVVAKKEPNKKLHTGEIELTVSHLDILSSAKPLPISVNDEQTLAHEENRLTYRYLDMRRGYLHHTMRTRHTAQLSARNYMSTLGFLEIQTPLLCKSTPEGSRDYLVPSRVNEGMFYALPQSPQLYKQLLMIGGFDRYFQFATCLRDEDLRADRQPEFSQIDIEMSFSTQDELFSIVEGLVQEIFSATKGFQIEAPFQKMAHKECMEHYGTDKPDLRFGMRFESLDDLAKKSSLSVFHSILENAGRVKGFRVVNGSDLSRKKIDGYTEYVAEFGAKGLAWIKIQEDGSFSSSLQKFITDADQNEWIKRLELEPGDLAFILAGPTKTVNQALDHLRRKVAKDRNLIDPSKVSCLWVTEFPLLTFNEEENRIESEHHPFTGVHPDDLQLLDSKPLSVRSLSYDLVMNGYEIASGSQRIHSDVLQEKIFDLLEIDEETRKKRFGFFVEALQYGTPPHIGIALGFDRVCMILCETESIRDVVAFPKTQKAYCLMAKAPSSVEQEQLDELFIELKQEKQGV